MDFFKSVFSDDQEPLDVQRNQTSSVSESPSGTSEVQEEGDPDREALLDEYESNPNPSPTSSAASGWSFGGFIKTFATKSESVLQTYRRDLEEFSSGLKKETEALREAASRAVKDLPASIEVGASVAQESLESVGQAIDDLGNTVWRGTAEIISHGKDVLLSADQESDSSDSQHLSNPILNSKRYSRFEAQVHSIQTDLNTYCEEPDDLDDFNKWKSGFLIEEKANEIENLCSENGVMEGIYIKLVPNTVDHETFWGRYFYRVHKLKQMEDARANLVKRAICGEEEEDLSWDVDDDDEEEETNASDLKDGTTDNKASEKHVEVSQSRSSDVVPEMEGKTSDREIDEKSHIVESVSDNGTDENKVLPEAKADLAGSHSDESVAKSDEKQTEGKADHGESCKDSDVSVVSSQPSVPEEEDLGWDEIEDLGSNFDKKTVGGSTNRADLCKRLSVADDDEDLSWDIEDDDEPVKP
ncbi:PREDICTED: BSD domain-containing protein 1-like [Nelumbo nucifera]|uniref:BSD domain-containing protein 1-like n=2 Tax=Nelumbo nucifera TaxID=4432 RepID=A0A1U8BG08_NELNU|nr:PREDICTED: BSD domain-containing protein 1-like [Nelumbo nucifera]DAD33532.1 TPA_asm: hypothetical protein HUJ06_012383 [Nelumbo nucifera]